MYRVFFFLDKWTGKKCFTITSLLITLNPEGLWNLYVITDKEPVESCLWKPTYNDESKTQIVKFCKAYKTLYYGWCYKLWHSNLYNPNCWIHSYTNLHPTGYLLTEFDRAYMQEESLNAEVNFFYWCILSNT